MQHRRWQKNTICVGNMFHSVFMTESHITNMCVGFGWPKQATQYGRDYELKRKKPTMKITIISTAIQQRRKCVNRVIHVVTKCNCNQFMFFFLQRMRSDWLFRKIAEIKFWIQNWTTCCVCCYGDVADVVVVVACTNFIFPRINELKQTTNR